MDSTIIINNDNINKYGLSNEEVYLNIIELFKKDSIEKDNKLRFLDIVVKVEMGLILFIIIYYEWYNNILCSKI